MCRNCHDDMGEFIVPCKCSGSIKYVHRECLDKWRTISPIESSFYQCDICQEKYQFKEVHSKKECIPAKCKFVSMVTVDISVILITWQILVFILTGLVILIDWNRARDNSPIPFPSDFPRFLIDYIFGLASFFLILGIGSTIFAICACILYLIRPTEQQKTYSSINYPYYRSSYHDSLFLTWYFYPIWYRPYSYGFFDDSLDCCIFFMIFSRLWTQICLLGVHFLGFFRDAKIAAIIGIIVLIICLIFISIGVIVGAILFIYLVYLITMNRIYLLNQKERVFSNEVLNLE